jgi:hypothetical protein
MCSGFMIDDYPIRTWHQAVCPLRGGSGRRLHVAAETVTVGRGLVAAASRAMKVARSTVGRGLKDLGAPASLTRGIRRKGAGRPTVTAKDPMLLDNLRQLLEPATMGDLMRPQRWTSKSHDNLATALREMGHKVTASSMPKLLRQLAYRRHVDRKTKDGSNHPDHDAQFEYINAKAPECQAADQPVISLDTKKKELLREFKTAGSDYGPNRKPIEVDAHDFENKELGKVVPYGIYDVGANSGYVSLGINHDTAQFAVNAARLWLDKMGREHYPATGKVMVTADRGGSHGPHLWLWKVELQRRNDETGPTFQVCHYPPGTSKWDKIEHRMLCHATQNWRAKPPTSRLAVVELIANTTTKTGLTVRCELDANIHPKGIKVADAEMAPLNPKGDKYRPDWNHSIPPRNHNVWH